MMRIACGIASPVGHPGDGTLLQKRRSGVRNDIQNTGGYAKNLGVLDS